MTQESSSAQNRHIELLCGGMPSFMVAQEIRSAVVSLGASCHIIHLDRLQEEGEHGKEDEFVPLIWDGFSIDRLRERLDRGSNHNNRNRDRQRLEAIFTQFPENETPYNHPFAIRLAAQSVEEQVRDTLFRALDDAVFEGKHPYVAICLVPEGPTGSGVAFSLIDWLPKWRVQYLREHADKGLTTPEFFNFFLIEFAPADAGNPQQGGNRENILQGYMTRKRLHNLPPEKWPHYWFRFDGSKVDQRPGPYVNEKASRIGAMAIALILTQRIAPPVYSSEEEEGST